MARRASSGGGGLRRNGRPGPAATDRTLPVVSPPDPLVAQLREEIAWLRGQVSDMRMALVALGDTKALAQVEYLKAIAAPTSAPPTPVAKKEKTSHPAPESQVHYASLMAEGHLPPPVASEEEEEIIRREAEREFELEVGSKQ